MRKVVINSTPLIALTHIGKLSLLKDLYGSVYIPMAVYEEISVKEDSICKLAVDNATEWLHVQQIENQMARELFKTQLHKGEVEVMILAKEKDADLLVIDDKNAKKYAKYLGLNVTGTLGILLKAKREGYITEVKPLIEEMQVQQIYLSDRIIEMCLRQAGEL